MDDIEGGVLARIPPGALSLTLTRSAIRMHHTETWHIDKTNPVEDLVFCLQGQGLYDIGGQEVVLDPGEAMLIPRDTRFRGQLGGTETYMGLAQHFSLRIYGDHDLIAEMELRPKVRMSRWEELRPMIWHYRQTSPPGSVTLAQHHLFMVFLIAYLEDAFLDWRNDTGRQLEGAEAINIWVMKAASRISAAPLRDGIAEEVVADAPYNPDYFLRAFRDRIGRTPLQYREFCRMERAMHLVETGMSVGQVAGEVGFADPYYFSRVFKRVMGISPRGHVNRIRQSRDGRLMQFDEPEQEQRLSGG